VLAAIPYTTFPDIEIGPLTLRTFGIMVGIGVVLGAWIAARRNEVTAGISREETYSLATKLVIAGIVGARLTFVLSNWDTVDSPIDVIAVWEGGLQFSGGFIGAIIFGLPWFRRLDRLTRWRVLDGFAYGLAIGLAIGRIGCYAVGEHFGRTTSFFLGVRYDGGPTREGLEPDFPTPADLQLNGVGTVFHQTALYEFIYLLVLFGILTFVLRRRPPVATAMGIFCFVYGVCRFWSDSLRVNDKTVLGMTGAQYFALSLVVASAWIWLVVRPKVALLAAAEGEAADDLAVETETDHETEPDEVDPGGDADADPDADGDEPDDEADDASAEVEDGAR
jgi:phosphatidylglycerol:prolipoprotein diacylglycerol transferase